MEPTDLTLEILKDIRAEIRETRIELSQRIDQTNTRLDQTNERLDQTNERLDHTIDRIDLVTEGQIRLATEVVGISSAMGELVTLLREDRVLRSRVDDHDHRIEALERQAGSGRSPRS